MISRITMMNPTSIAAPMPSQTHFEGAAFLLRRESELRSPDRRTPLADDAAALPSTSSKEMGVSCAGDRAGSSGFALRSPLSPILELEALLIARAARDQWCG